MKRRTFLTSLLGLPLVNKVKPKLNLNFAGPAQESFFGCIDGAPLGRGNLPPFNYMGIPYHHDNFSTGTWLGISRSKI